MSSEEHDICQKESIVTNTYRDKIVLAKTSALSIFLFLLPCAEGKRKPNGLHRTFLSVAAIDC